METPNTYTKIAFVIMPDFLQRVATLVASAKSSPRLAQYLAKGGETPFAVVPVRIHFNQSSHSLKNESLNTVSIGYNNLG